MKWSQTLALYLFWPAVAVVGWSELTPNPPQLETEVWDKALHFTAYFGLAGIATMALGGGKRALWAVLSLIALGATLEVLQGFTGRDPSVFDEFANTLGALSGAGLGWALINLLRPKILQDIPFRRP